MFVVRSTCYAEAQAWGLEKHLRTATTALLWLTPPPGRGKRQFRDATALVKAADAILQTQRVEGLLSYGIERQEIRTTRYIGLGRGADHRPTCEVVQARYQISAVVPQEEAIAALRTTLGWRAYVLSSTVRLWLTR